MTKKSSKPPATTIVAPSVLNELQNCRPLRLFIKKQKKKGNEGNPFAIRRKFIQMDHAKQLKYFQKSVKKYLQLLDEKQIDEKTQIEGQLFEQVLTKKEQKTYFQWLDAPEEPAHNVAWFYSQWQKENSSSSSEPWKNLPKEEKDRFVKLHNQARDEFPTKLKNFLENLPTRLQADFLCLVKPTKSDDKEEKSVDEVNAKLTRSELEELHRCKPSEIYYEKKVSADEKPTFSNSTARNNHLRALFNKLSEKKRKKFVLKAAEKWLEFLEANPSVSERKVPTLHLLLNRNQDILTYFSSLGLPSRPPISAFNLYNSEREQNSTTVAWNDLPQTTKDELIKRVGKLKSDFNENLKTFVEQTLPSDYLRFEFFRNVKTAAKDYQTATKNRQEEKVDDGQLKITKYLRKKSSTQISSKEEFQQIYQKLLATKLNNEQKSLIERLAAIINKNNQDKPEETVVLLNGDESTEEPKKRKRDRTETKTSKKRSNVSD